MNYLVLTFFLLIWIPVILSASEKVNVVLIFADDQGYGDLGALAQKK